MKKYLLGLLLAVMLLVPIGSAVAFWHPPDDEPEVPCPTFAVVIDGVGFTTPDDRFNFTEPEYGFCTDVTVEIYLIDVEDLFAYEFKLWWNTVYFALTGWVVEEVWPSQFVVMPDATYDGSRPYHQAVSALAPSTGASGTFLLATLTFHIINDVCWTMDDVLGCFELYGLKASNSCSDPIELCDPMHGYWRFIPVQPKIYFDPEEEINCVVGETFTMTIMVEDIVKMKSLHLWIYWYKNEMYKEPGVWMPIICTTEDDVVINEEVVPPEAVDTFTVTIVESLDVTELFIDLVIDCDWPLINGTFWIFEITFLKQDPWYSGRQPEYSKENHEWDTDNATTTICFWQGYFDVMCPDYAEIWFGEDFGDHTGDRWWAIYKCATFTFDPVPGDLNGDGVVDVTDLAIIASFYGMYHPDDWDYPVWYYDFVDDNLIDIFDVTVVAKNFGRSCPY